MTVLLVRSAKAQNPPNVSQVVMWSTLTNSAIVKVGPFQPTNSQGINVTGNIPQGLLNIYTESAGGGGINLPANYSIPTSQAAAIFSRFVEWQGELRHERGLMPKASQVRPNHRPMVCSFLEIVGKMLGKIPSGVLRRRLGFDGYQTDSTDTACRDLTQARKEHGKLSVRGLVCPYSRLCH